jgi:RNA polymerase sigma-70 factor (ECF subfamily)
MSGGGIAPATCYRIPLMKPSSATDAAQLRAEFTALYAGCAEWLYSYLFSLLRNNADADEVLQETAKVLWEKFDQYHRGTEFRAWACRIAHFKALKHRQQSQRLQTTFSDLWFEAVDEEAVVMADRLDVRMVALNKCLEKLPSPDRELLEQRYAPQANVEEMARSLARSTHSVYRALARIHAVLLRCINRALAEEVAP